MIFIIRKEESPGRFKYSVRQELHPDELGEKIAIAMVDEKKLNWETSNETKSHCC